MSCRGHYLLWTLCVYLDCISIISWLSSPVFNLCLDQQTSLHLWVLATARGQPGNLHCFWATARGQPGSLHCTSAKAGGQPNHLPSPRCWPPTTCATQRPAWRLHKPCSRPCSNPCSRPCPKPCFQPCPTPCFGNPAPDRLPNQKPHMRDYVCFVTMCLGS